MPARLGRGAALSLAVGITVARFLVIFLGLRLAALLGIPGWYMGLFANTLCVLFAVALVTWLGLWRGNGLAVAWRSRTAALLVLRFVLEALVWIAVPGGLENRAPGFGLWALTLLMVGVNEELVSRVAILRTLAASYSRGWTAVLTAALFGLQHLSQLAVTTRSVDDVWWNVLLSAIGGFAFAVFQLRFAWLWPLVLCHAAADYTQLMMVREPPDLWYAAVHVLLAAYGVWLLWSGRGRPNAVPEQPPSRPDPHRARTGRFRTGSS